VDSLIKQDGNDSNQVNEYLNRNKLLIFIK